MAFGLLMQWLLFLSSIDPCDFFLSFQFISKTSLTGNCVNSSIPFSQLSNSRCYFAGRQVGICFKGRCVKGEKANETIYFVYKHLYSQLSCCLFYLNIKHRFSILSKKKECVCPFIFRWTTKSLYLIFFLLYEIFFIKNKMLAVNSLINYFVDPFVG